MMEPLPPGGRLTSDMTDPHAQHDRTRIAVLAARPDDLSTEDARLARQLIADCEACTDLLADLIEIQAAVPHAAMPSRTREFTLSQADASRLGRTGWRRFLAMVGSSRDQVTRPLAMGLTTLGLAGVIVATLPGSLGSGATSAVPAEVARQEQAAPAAGAPNPGLFSMTTGPDTAGSPDGAGFQEGQPDVRTDQGGSDAASDLKSMAIRDDVTGLSTLLVLGGVLIILGMGLFGLRWTARRFGDG